MIKIDMELHIDVKNHSAVICKGKGKFFGGLLNLPGVKIISHSEMDKEVKARIITSLHNTLPLTIKDELRKKGIDADVFTELK